MKKRTEPQEPVASTPRGGPEREDCVTSGPSADSANDKAAKDIMDRSFVKEELTGSFHNHNPFTLKGDCRIEKGVMAPSTLKIPASSSDGASSKTPSEMTMLSAHSSDDDLVLICMDCGREINEQESGMLCPVTAKLHG